MENMPFELTKDGRYAWRRYATHELPVMRMGEVYESIPGVIAPEGCNWLEMPTQVEQLQPGMYLVKEFRKLSGPGGWPRLEDIGAHPEIEQVRGFYGREDEWNLSKEAGSFLPPLTERQEHDGAGDSSPV